MQARCGREILILYITLKNSENVKEKSRLKKTILIIKNPEIYKTFAGTVIVVGALYYLICELCGFLS